MKAKPLYIAVVAYMDHLIRQPDVAISQAQDGSGCYSSFIGYNKGAVIRKALYLARLWGEQRNRKYTVLAGRLENKAEASFTLKVIR